MPTTRWGLRFPGSSSAPNVPLDIQNLATDLDGVAMDDQGLLSARPVSTAPSPGKKGRYYFATDTVQLFRDTGTSWTEVAPSDAVFGRYDHIREAACYLLASGPSTGTTVFSGFTQNPEPVSGTDAHTAVFYLDPADYAAAPRTTRLRLRASLTTNATAPGGTRTVGLYPVTAISGGAVTLGAVVSGSTVAFAGPAANTRNQGNSGDFTAPAAGYYCLAVAHSAAMTAGSSAFLRAALQTRAT